MQSLERDLTGADMPVRAKGYEEALRRWLQKNSIANNRRSLEG
jgi:hypothetical protein